MSFEALAKKGYNKFIFYVYILRSKVDKSYYVGFSEDLRKRLKDHEWYDVKSTKSKAPYDLIWYGGFKEKRRALNFERYLKSGSGFAFRNKHLI
ncbi:MAG: GIY-YIG nuclease family protein [Patescibacteria group bacterium]